MRFWKTSLNQRSPHLKFDVALLLFKIKIYLEDWFQEWWLLFLSLLLLVIGFALTLGFQLINVESARWTLSALIQAGAALMGIFFVALSLLWNRAIQERERLRDLKSHYILTFASNTVAIIDLQNTLLKITTEDAFKSSREITEMVRDCWSRFMVLRLAESYYSDKKAYRHEVLSQLSHGSIGLSDRMQKEIIGRAAVIAYDEIHFFQYLLDFDEKLSSMASKLKLKDKGSYHLSEILNRARKHDQVGVSLYRIRIFRVFSGKRLKVTLSMWLLCVIVGILTLVSIDSIPGNLLPYFTCLTIAIGVIAIGITLSLGFQVMRSSD